MNGRNSIAFCLVIFTVVAAFLSVGCCPPKAKGAISSKIAREIATAEVSTREGWITAYARQDIVCEETGVLVRVYENASELPPFALVGVDFNGNVYHYDLSAE